MLGQLAKRFGKTLIETETDVFFNVISRGVWILLREADLANNLKTQCFKSMSRLGALTEKLMASAHAAPPFSLFLSIDQPTLAKALKERPACLLDRW
eukprot:6457024-Pyramimonas_sp.AAC.1